MSFNPAYYGNFWNTGQLTAVANTPTAMTYNSSSSLKGVSVVSNSRITVTYAGLYNIAYSAQFENTSGGTQTVGVWLRRGGVDVADTAGQVSLGNNERVIGAWNYFIELAVNEYVELYWATPSASVVVYAQAAQVAPPSAWAMPAVPSIILTINKVN